MTTDVELSPEAMERLAKALEDPERLRCGDWYCHRFDRLDHDGTLAAAVLRAASAGITRLTAERDEAERRGAHRMRERVASLAEQTAENRRDDAADAPRRQKAYATGRADACAALARAIRALPLPGDTREGGE